MDFGGWRARLERSWRVTVDQIVAMSVACHEAAPPSESGLPGLSALAASSGRGDARLARLVGRLMAAHGELAEIEAALDRIKAGSYGACEDCGLPMHHDWLDATPHVRTCAECSPDQMHLARCAVPAGQLPPAPRRPADLAGCAG